MKYNFHHRSIRALLFIVALATTALGCVWLGTPDSVRFNDTLSYREMERLPPLPFADQTDTTSNAPANKQPTEEQKRLLEYSKRAGVALDQWFPPDDLKGNASVDKFDALTALNHGSPFSHVQA